MKKLFFVICIALLSAGCNKTVPPSPASAVPVYDYSHNLQIAGQNLMVEIVDTSQKMQQGLSGRDSMAQNQGMLFEFGSETDPAFWMPDMKFNLDFIWVDQNPSTDSTSSPQAGSGQVVGVTDNVPAPTAANPSLPYYYPPSPVNWVVEVNAGWAKKNNIKVGDEVNLVE